MDILKPAAVSDLDPYAPRELFNAIRETERDVREGFREIGSTMHSIDGRLGRVETILAESLIKQVSDHEERIRRLQAAVFVFAPLVLTLLGILITATRMR